MDIQKRKRQVTVEEWLRELDEEIKLARKQAGYPVDNDISDGPEPDDEESNA